KRPAALLRLPASIRTATCLQCRQLHRLNAPTPSIPKPTPFVPDVQTFLTLIGRNLSQHATKIPSWEALFTLSGQQLREAGVEPARARRYLLWWRDRFRNGISGIGGDMANVKDGVAELRIAEVPSQRKTDSMATLSKDAGMRKVIVNSPPSLPEATTVKAEEGAATEDKPVHILPLLRLRDASEAKPLSGVKIIHGTAISGRGIEYVKGYPGFARLKVKEGLWENRRGHKVDGGERRKAEVRAKRRVQERK
ncbi:IGR protein motif-domain-containing protein, partial [Neohortaea acidophila]